MGVAPKARLEAQASATGLSHALWMLVVAPEGGSEEPELDFQRLLSASSWWGQVTGKDVELGLWRKYPHAAEAKKAEGTSMVALLIPNPPK